jgi:hypothetical protein
MYAALQRQQQHSKKQKLVLHLSKPSLKHEWESRYSNPTTPHSFYSMNLKFESSISGRLR